MDRLTERQRKNGWEDEKMDRQKDRYVNSQIKRWKDRNKERYIDRQINK